MYRRTEKTPFSEILPKFTEDLKGLISWLEFQDPTTEYNHESTVDCVLARFFTAYGRKDVWVGRLLYSTDGGEELPLSENFVFVSGEAPYTYGAALQRAYKENS